MTKNQEELGPSPPRSLWSRARILHRVGELIGERGSIATARHIASRAVYMMRAAGPAWCLYRRWHRNLRFEREPPDVATLSRALRSQTLARVAEIEIDRQAYEEYLRWANYARYAAYSALDAPGSALFTKKTLEHYLTAAHLEFRSEDTVVDVASCDSPFADIVRDVFGATTYKQDLVFPAGIHGDKIGGDAGALVLEAASVTKMSLHCSFEHFEGDADVRFIREAGRVLRPGGHVYIVPLYLHQEFHALTDPFVDRSGIVFDEEAAVIPVRYLWNRHWRYYDVEHLASRVLRATDSLAWTVQVFSNPEVIDRSGLVQFALLGEKLAGNSRGGTAPLVSK